MSTPGASFHFGMLRSKTNREAASTSFKDAVARKSKKISEKKKTEKEKNESQSCQKKNPDDMITVDEETEPVSTPKQENTFRDLGTPDVKTQTRLTLKYDDLLLSQTVDPQCEVSWECISPEVVQKIHRDIQRKPNLDISKILASLKDFQEDDSPTNSISSLKRRTSPFTSHKKTVPLKRKLKSARKVPTSSKMEKMIKKLEMQIKNDAEDKLTDDTKNHKRIMDSLESILPLQRTSSENQGNVTSNPTSTKKCLPSVSELAAPSSSSDSKVAVSIDQNINHSALINNEETSWSDDELFCDESFIAKVAQTSENKTNTTIEKNKLSSDYKNQQNCYKNLLLSRECTSDITDRKAESNDAFPNTCKSANSVTSDFTVKTDSGNTNDVADDFSDSDTDELLSQITEQEISCSVGLVHNKDNTSTKDICIDNPVGLPRPVIASTVAYKTDKKLPVIEKTSVDAFLEFLDIPMSDSFRKPSPRKPFKTTNESSTKKKSYNFKSLKNNNKQNTTISATCTLTSEENNVDPMDNSFDDPFSDKDDEILKFAESLDRTEEKVEESKKPLNNIPEILPKVKPVCTKEEIERKKRKALIRRKKLSAITKLSQ